jgi:hypothetical protein
MDDYWANQGPMFLFVMVGVVVLICVFISQINNNFAIIAALIGLAFFIFVIISQIDRLTTTRWTLLDLIIAAAICFIAIWGYPDIRNIIRQRNQK